MVGQVTPDTPHPNGSYVSNLFADDIIACLPDIVCNKVVTRVAELLQKNSITPSSELSTRTVKSVVQLVAAHLGVIASDINLKHGSGATAVAAAHGYCDWKKKLFSHVCSKLMECLEKAEPVVGEVRKRQEEEEERRRKKEEEERLKEEEERRSREEQERAAADQRRQLEEEKDRKEKEEKIRRDQEQAEQRRRDEELRQQEEAAAAAAAARKEKEAELQKLLNEFGIQHEDAGKLAAAGVKTVGDLKMIDHEDLDAFALSFINKKKFVKLLEHVGSPAFLAAAAKKKQEEDVKAAAAAAEEALKKAQEQEERLKLEYEARRREEQERADADQRRQLEEEKDRKEKEEKIRRDQEQAEQRRRDEELKQQEEAAAAAAAARKEKEAELQKLLNEFGIQHEDAGKLAAAGVKTGADLMVLHPDDLAAIDLSVVGKRKFEMLLQHAGAPAFLAASEKKRLEEEAEMALKKKQSDAGYTYHLSLITYHSSLITYQLSLISYRLSLITCLQKQLPPPVIAYQLSLITYYLPAEAAAASSLITHYLPAEAAAASAAAAAEMERKKVEEAAKAAAAAAAAAEAKRKQAEEEAAAAEALRRKEEAAAAAKSAAALAEAGVLRRKAEEEAAAAAAAAAAASAKRKQAEEEAAAVKAGKQLERSAGKDGKMVAGSWVQIMSKFVPEGNAKPRELLEGAIGEVVEIDDDGDAKIRFQGCHQFVLSKQFKKLAVCAKEEALAALLRSGKCSMAHPLLIKATSEMGSGSRRCDILSDTCTRKDFSDEEVQWFHCPICDYDVCLSCAPDRVNGKGDRVRLGAAGGSGGFTGLQSGAIFYCGEKKDECRCGGCDGRCGPTNGCPCASCYALLSHAQPKVGDRVRVKRSVSTPEYEWGSVSHKSTGVLKRIDADGDVMIDFPSQSSWKGKLGEIEVDDRKFVKGCRVKLTANYKEVNDATDGPLKPGNNLFQACFFVLISASAPVCSFWQNLVAAASH